MNRLQKFYDNIICFDLVFKDHYINIMELPQLNQITFNTGLGLKAILDKKQILIALLNMELVSGQRPIITRAKKSIDKFKLRENMPVGCKVTLRKNLLYIFLDRFINIIIPSLDISSIPVKQVSIKDNQLNNLLSQDFSSEVSIVHDLTSLGEEERGKIGSKDIDLVSSSTPLNSLKPFTRFCFFKFSFSSYKSCFPLLRSKI